MFARCYKKIQSCNIGQENNMEPIQEAISEVIHDVVLQEVISQIMRCS